MHFNLVDICLCTLFIPTLVVWATQWIFHFGAIIHGRRVLHKKTKRSPKDKTLPGVSILKPLCGVDPNLYENLESFFTMDYPTYELIFCFDKEDDEAIPLVKSLMMKYPHVPAKIMTGGREVGINPKINNMIIGYEEIKYDFFLISDAGIQLRKDTLLSMVETMEEDVGEVHQVPYCLDRPGFGAKMEKLYFGTFHGKAIIFLDLFSLNCVNGMSCLFRKKIIDDKGGLEAFAQYLAEDFHFTRVVLESGYRVKMCPQPAQQNTGFISVKVFQERMMRWIKLRGSLLPYILFVEPVSECMVQGLIVAWAYKYFFGLNPILYFVSHVLLWILLDYILLGIVENGPIPLSKSEFLRIWFYRETNAFFLWVRAISKPSLKWRTHEFVLKWHSVAEKHTSLYNAFSGIKWNNHRR